MNQSRYPLRLSETIKIEAAQYAEKENMSLNSFIQVAVVRMVEDLRAREFFADRSKLADRRAFRQFLSRKGLGEPLRSGDEVPEGINFIKDLHNNSK
ncbi:MAG: toxin-antitoxin system HicB family antitoxin [Pseudomonadota bacterium]